MGSKLRSVALLGVAMVLLAGCGDDGDGTTESSPEAGAAALGSVDEVTVAAAADIGMEADGRATLGAIGAAEPDVAVAFGDLSYAGPGSEQEFCDLAGSLVGEATPIELLAGNHEEDTGEDGRIRNYAACLPDRVGAVGEYGTQYYFDVGDLARFVMISPDLTIEGQHYYYGPDDDGSDTPQLAWFKEAVSGAREAGIPWVVVGMHKPCISVGEYYCDVYQDLFTTVIEERVDLVISGHDHSYQRSKQISTGGGCDEVVVDEFDPACVVDEDDELQRGDGTVFLVAGSGGAELYPVNRDDPEAGYFATAMGKNTEGNRSGFALLSISQDELTVRFAGSTPGEFEDRFSITD
jgi:3',5'-cyclic AMP phosphodiesterase CpdA